MPIAVELLKNLGLLLQCHALVHGRLIASIHHLHRLRTTLKIQWQFPFLDHLIQDLSERFDSHSKTVALLQGLLPKNINTDTSFQDVEEAVLFYKDDLPNYIIIG